MFSKPFPLLLYTLLFSLFLGIVQLVTDFGMGLQ